MKMQARTSVAVLVVVCLLSGCGSKTDAPEEDELKPGEAKTKAAMLLGKWKLVKQTPPWMPAETTTREYRRDGKIVKLMYNPYDGERISFGTYEVDGDTIYHDFNNEVGRRAATLETVTADTLVISGVAGDEKYRTEYERIRK